MSVVEVGDKVHIITRRWFEEDIRRHFAGEVIKSDGLLCEVRGYVFVFHSGTNEYRRRSDPRTRILSFADAGQIVNKLPADVKLGSLEYRVEDGRLVVTDGSDFALDINEFGSSA